jgi:hypothetical protein
LAPTASSVAQAIAMSQPMFILSAINAKTAEAIANQFPTVRLEQVHPTILYCLQNKTALDQYLSDGLDYTLTLAAEQDNNPDPGIQRLKALKASSAA